MSKNSSGKIRSRFGRPFSVPAIFLALVLTTLAGALYGAAIYKEDINTDGRVNVADVLTLLLMGNANAHDPRADFNGDGIFTFTDATDLITRIRTGNLTLLPPPEPKIALSADSLAFGNVTEGTSLPDTLDIFNIGNAPLTVSGITTTDSAFTASPDTVTVAPLKVGRLHVTFRPRALGLHSATLSVLSNDPAHPSLPVKVNGSGIAPPAPRIVLSTDSLSFGNVDVNTSKVLTFNISNQGNANLAVSGIVSSDAEFKVSPVSAAISPTQSKVIDVTFTPLATGAKNAVLTISSNDPAHATLTFAVSGTGIVVLANKTYQIQALDDRFNPNSLTIAVGDTVRWTNSGARAHTATSGTNGSPDGKWDSGNLNPGQSFSHVFTAKGTYPYYCTYHYAFGMTGTITVN
jgi:plastocyanin